MRCIVYLGRNLIPPLFDGMVFIGEGMGGTGRDMTTAICRWKSKECNLIKRRKGGYGAAK